MDSVRDLRLTESTKASENNCKCESTTKSNEMVTPTIAIFIRQSSVPSSAPTLQTFLFLTPRRSVRWRVRTAQRRLFHVSDSTARCAHLADALDPIGWEDNTQTDQDQLVSDVE